MTGVGSPYGVDKSITQSYYIYPCSVYVATPIQMRQSAGPNRFICYIVFEKDRGGAPKHARHPAPA